MRSIILTVVVFLEKMIDLITALVGGAIDDDVPLQIVPYVGYGNRQHVRVRARVLRDRGIISPTNSDSLWRNFHNNYKRFHTDEIPGAKVEITLGGVSQIDVADEEGFIDTEFELTTTLDAAAHWHDAALRLVEPERTPTVTAVQQVLVAPGDAQYGVISDLDDTVLQSNVSNILKLAMTVLLGNAHTRQPFAGVPAFYQAMQRGTHNGFNPIYYVTSSPWNLYDLIIDFLKIRAIPLGPVFMTDWGVTETQLFKPTHDEHKLGAIRAILDKNAGLPFVLLGDSSEDDARIYATIIKENPSRIIVAYIRDVTDAATNMDLQRIISEVNETGSAMLLIADTVVTAEDAAQRGLIAAEALPDIRA